MVLLMSLLLLFPTQPGNKNLSPTQAQVATIALVKNTVSYKALSPAQPQVASVDLFKNTVYYKALTLTQGQIATLTIYKPTQYTKTLSPAQAQVATLAIAKTNFALYAPVITIAGVARTSNIRLESLSIQDLINEQPNLAHFTCVGITPTVGQDVKIGLGSVSSRDLVFGGTITTIEQIYEGTRANVAYHVTCQDYTYLLNRRRPLVTYTGVSATTILTSLIGSYSSGFTTTGVVAALGAVTITFDGSRSLAECITDVASAIGGYWYPDYSRDIHFFLTETGGPTTIDATNILPSNSAGARTVAQHQDLSQVRTRVIVIGGGSSTLDQVLAGATSIQVRDGSFYSSGTLITPDSQTITYTALSNLAAPAAPSVGKGYGIGSNTTGDLRNISSITRSGTTVTVTTVGAHGYGTGSVVAITGTTVYDGRRAIIVTGSTTFTFQIGTTPGSVFGGLAWHATSGQLVGSYLYKVSFVTAGGETLASSASAAVAPTGVTSPSGATLTATTGGALTPSSSYWYGVAFVTSLGETDAATGLTVTLNAAQNAVSLTNISTAADNRVLARRIYRGVAGSTTLYALATIADNTTTTYTDTTADTGLDFATPALTENRAGYGAVTLTSLPVSADSRVTGRKLYRTIAGGSTYLLVGSIGDNTSTAWTDTVADASLGQAEPTKSTVPALLTGVSGVTTTIPAGSALPLMVTRNDVTAQAVIAALEGGDGIHEFTVKDSSLVTVAACNARGDAELALFKTFLTEITYVTRDVATRAGKPITVNLGSPTNISVTLQIQSVTWSQFGIPNQPPLLTVKAGQVKFNLQDLLRRVALT